jgi:UDP-N-acetylglucosamine 4-epimerase
VSKYADELYARVFGQCYGLELLGLRYFNVFGPRQDPQGAYAAVIPRWFSGLLEGATITINGDGETTRDFCFVENVVQANLLAATTASSAAVGEVFNIGCGERTTLNELFLLIRRHLARFFPRAEEVVPRYRGFRSGDVRHSLADIARASGLLGYSPTHSIDEGLACTAGWYAARHQTPWRHAAGSAPPGEHQWVR